MAATYNYEWNQGEDLLISLVYKSGPVGSAEPVDLNLYSFRMDIVAPDGKVLTVANDQAITDTNMHDSVVTADNEFEVTLNAPDKLGNPVIGSIMVELSRSLTLPGGAFYKYLTANPAVKAFSYDMFLRDNKDKQKKILAGTITIERSVTHWA